MSAVISLLERQFNDKNFHFIKKPILIGGMAMEYYGMRKSGADIDLIICDEDYQALAHEYPDSRKDIWGDLGVVLEPFEIWRCIMLLDYDFYLKDAVDEKIAYVVSLDRLLLMRVFAMDVPKYMDDLKIMKDYYCRTFRNRDFAKVQEINLASYQSSGGTIWGGKYID
ncbi:MAG: hypothetical protein FWC55_08695 [Firmicutes bacterium]|nr:hypothetical protein [Bacillota bacterium]